jgi:hypothetical protein
MGRAFLSQMRLLNHSAFCFAPSRLFELATNWKDLFMTRIHNIATTYAIAIAALLTLPISSALAQSERAADSAASGSAASQTQPIDDATLQHAAKAFVKVTKIAENEKSTMSTASDEASKKQAAEQAESDKLAAVKSEGLQPQQYNQVLQVVQNDNNLQQKFFSYAKSGESESPGNNM